MSGYYNFLLPFKNRGCQDDVYEITVFLDVKPCTEESISSIYMIPSYHKDGDSRFHRKGVQFVFRLHSTTPHTNFRAYLCSDLHFNDFKVIYCHITSVR